MKDYSDIIYYNYTGPKNHVRTPHENRAGQFASFKALSGYYDELQEVRRIVDKKILLSDDKIEQINNMLIYISNNKELQVKFTYYVKDLKKEGGFYKTIIGKVKKIKLDDKIIILDNEINLIIDNILDLEILN